MAANVLTFDASRRRTHRQGVMGGAAEILMFSGVRYERPESKTSEQPASASPPVDPLDGGGNPRRRM